MTNKTMGIIGMVLGALCVLSKPGGGFLGLAVALPPGGISISWFWLAEDCADRCVGAAVFVVGWILY